MRIRKLPTEFDEKVVILGMVNFVGDGRAGVGKMIDYEVRLQKIAATVNGDSDIMKDEEARREKATKRIYKK